MEKLEYQLAPSILAADFNCLGEQIKEVESNGVEVLHIDVMDGMFVPSISFGMPVISSIRRNTGLFFDVHLMVQEPIRYLKEFVNAGADSITIHVEACEDVKATIDEIHALGVQCGISLNPGTSVESLKPYLEDVDMVLVMSVNPGFGGQKFMPDSLDKVEFLVNERKKQNYKYRIEIDGGVNKENVSHIVEKGVDIVVAGTAVFGGDITENVNNMRR